ncbi:MAG: hypothetical protein ACT4PT_10975 [Methanobacteriota archaeon]
MTSGLLLGAAGLLVAIGVAHSYLGEKHILRRLVRREDLPKLFGSDVFTRRTIRLAWHATSIAWWGFALVLLSPEDPDHVLYATSATFGVSAVIAAVGTRGRHLSWIVFAAIAALAFAAV